MKNEEKDHPQVGMLGAAARARDFIAHGDKPCSANRYVMEEGFAEQAAVLREVLFEDQQMDHLTSYCRDLVAEVLGAEDDTKPRYLIVSAHPPTYTTDAILFWGPDEKGYTVDVSKAGRYTRRQALRITRGSSEAKMVDLLDVVKKMKRVVYRYDAREMLP